MDATGCWQSQHTNDVHTDTWKLCMGWESGAAIWNSGLEYVGNISRYRGTARSIAGHGNIL